MQSARNGLDRHRIILSEELANATTTSATVDLLLDSDPELVAFSVYVWNAGNVSALIDELRRRDSSLPVVLGGPEVQHTPGLALQRFNADFVCTGEGENAFLGLIEHLSSSRSAQSGHPPPGIVNRFGSGGPAPLIFDLDTIPSPFRSETISIPDSGWVDIETVRGCPFSCSFCLYGKNLSAVREFSLERIRLDVEWLLSNGATDIYFLDPTFNLPKDRCRAILDVLASINHDRSARIYVEARAEAVDDDLADRFVAAGITEVEVGLQAVEADALKLMRRSLGRQGFPEGCRRLSERGISVEIGMIAGLPGDTAASLRRTAAYAMQDLLGHVSVYRLRALPGSDYWHRAKELGLEYAQTPPYFVTSTPRLSARALEAVEAEVRAVTAPHNEAYRASVGRVGKPQVAKVSKISAKERGGTRRVSDAGLVGVE